MRCTARRVPQAALLASLAVCPTPWSAEAQDRGSRLFATLAGTWEGAGTVSAMGGGAERLRCIAAYSPSDAAHLTLQLRCASDSFKMDVATHITRQGNHIFGGWSESTFGFSGDVDGAIQGNRIDATVTGMGTSAHFSMGVRGDQQAITLVSQGQISGTASVVLRRE